MKCVQRRIHERNRHVIKSSNFVGEVCSSQLLISFFLFSHLFASHSRSFFRAAHLFCKDKKKNVFKVTTNYRCFSSFFVSCPTKSTRRTTFSSLFVYLCRNAFWIVGGPLSGSDKFVIQPNRFYLNEFVNTFHGFLNTFIC